MESSVDAARRILPNLPFVAREAWRVRAELASRRLFYFLTEFWDTINERPLVPNWHVELFCDEAQQIVEWVAEGVPSPYHLILNVPPGTTKSTVFSQMLQAWAWTKYPWMQFICASFNSALSLEHADKCRDIVRHPRYRKYYDRVLRRDKDRKSNYQLIGHAGCRYSTSVGGTLTGYHGDVNVVDDPLDPEGAYSTKERETANRWVSETLPSRKNDKEISADILIMQRLEKRDCTHELLQKVSRGKRIRLICLPGELCAESADVSPKHLKNNYTKDGLLDSHRLSRRALKDLQIDLGTWGYKAQVLQNPGMRNAHMFLPGSIKHIVTAPPSPVVRTIRYWDKAGTQDGGAHTVGVKISLLQNGLFYVHDMQKGQWATHVREAKIKQTAIVDGKDPEVWVEQEPGSGGKESAERTIANLAGWNVKADKVTGSKEQRADPWSAQWNAGNVILQKASWNDEYIERHEDFPSSDHKDEVDASSGAFSKLVSSKRAGAW